MPQVAVQEGWRLAGDEVGEAVGYSFEAVAIVNRQGVVAVGNLEIAEQAVLGNIGDGTSDLFQIRLTLPLDKLGMPNARFLARGSWADSSVIDPVTGEERRLQGQQPFGCGIAFNQDLQGGKWSYGFDHGCNVDRNPNFRVREVRTIVSEPFVNIYGQWKPRSDLTVRLDIGNASNRAIGYDRDIYSGPRDVAPIAFSESRRTRMSRWLFVQIRKTF